MKPTTIVLMAAAIAILGTWSKKKTIDPKMVIGGAVVAIAVGFLADAEPDIGRDFAWLVLVATASAYGDDLFKAIGDAPSMLKGVKPASTYGQNTVQTGPGGTGSL